MADKQSYPPKNGFPNPWPSAYDKLRDYDTDLSRQLELGRQEIKAAFQAIYEGASFTYSGTAWTMSATSAVWAMTGNGARIKGIFNGATHANRTLFQNYNSAFSSVGVIPGSTGTQAGWVAYSTSDPDNSSFAFFYNDGTVTGIQSSKTGTGVTKPVAIALDSTTQVTWDSGTMTFAPTGYRIKADFSNATQSNRAMFQSSTVNGNTTLGILPNGTATVGALNVFGGSNPDATSTIQLVCDTGGGAARLAANRTGAGTFLPLNFQTNAVDALSILTTGVVSLLLGQLKFPATQNPSSDVNTLDDYEEGTWTPTIAGTTTAGTYTYTVQQGWYVKIGLMVFGYFRMTISGVTAAGTGTALEVAGLPFTSTASTASPANISFASGWGTAPISARVNGNTTRIRLHKYSSAVTFNQTDLVPADLTAPCEVWGGFAYQASA
jgi:hypothetical protein